MDFGIETYIIFVLAQLITAAAIWGGLRADIKHIHDNLKHIDKSVTDAHGRIDRLLERR